MPHQNLEIENGNRTPNRLRQHVWLDVSTFNKCLFTTKQGGFLLILICETSQIFVWRNKAFIFFQKSDIFFPPRPVSSLFGSARLAAFCPVWFCWLPPLLVGLAFSCVCVVLLCVFCLCLLLRFVLVGFASHELTEVTKDG